MNKSNSFRKFLKSKEIYIQGEICFWNRIHATFCPLFVVYKWVIKGNYRWLFLKNILLKLLETFCDIFCIMSKDSELSYATTETCLNDVVDDLWHKDQLPFDEILIPERELPPSDDTDNIDISETLKEQDEKWTDLGLQNLQESPRHN